MKPAPLDTANTRAWQLIAQSVLRGEHDRATDSHQLALIIGLRGNKDKDSVRATERLLRLRKERK